MSESITLWKHIGNKVQRLASPTYRVMPARWRMARLENALVNVLIAHGPIEKSGRAYCKSCVGPDYPCETLKGMAASLNIEYTVLAPAPLPSPDAPPVSSPATGHDVASATITGPDNDHPAPPGGTP